MALEIQKRIIEDIQVLEIKGRITLGESSGTLRSTLDELIRTGQSKIILDLAGVDYIDSSGLGALVMMATAAQKADGKLALLNLSKRNIELMVMTKLSTVFEIHNNETDAVNSFFPDRKVHKFDILNFVRGQQEN